MAIAAIVEQSQVIANVE
jgi:hypothetical protein